MTRNAPMNEMNFCSSFTLLVSVVNAAESACDCLVLSLIGTPLIRLRGSFVQTSLLFASSSSSGSIIFFTDPSSLTLLTHSPSSSFALPALFRRVAARFSRAAVGYRFLPCRSRTVVRTRVSVLLFERVHRCVIR